LVQTAVFQATTVRIDGELKGPMEKDRRDRLREDAVAWARTETVVFTRRKLKRYGLLSLLNAAAIVLILKGMPAHSWAPVLGLPFVISFVCVFTPVLYYGAMLIAEWFDKRQHP
jgi:hypothetical protein